MAWVQIRLHQYLEHVYIQLCVYVGLCWPLIRWLSLLPGSWPLCLWCFPCSCLGGYFSWPLWQPHSATAVVNSSTAAGMASWMAAQASQGSLSLKLQPWLTSASSYLPCIILGVTHIFKVHWESPFDSTVWLCIYLVLNTHVLYYMGMFWSGTGKFKLAQLRPPHLKFIGSF